MERPGTKKVSVENPYPRGDQREVFLAVSSAEPRPNEWRRAFWDTASGKRVLWARFPLAVKGAVWLRDSDGVRRVRPLS